jgi:hypothetical protein
VHFYHTKNASHNGAADYGKVLEKNLLSHGGFVNEQVRHLPAVLSELYEAGIGPRVAAVGQLEARPGVDKIVVLIALVDEI